MRLSKKKEKALSMAIDIMSTHLNNETHTDYNELLESINELIDLYNRSVISKAKAKKRNEYLKNLLENSNTITLDGKWYYENVRNQ